MPRLNKNKNQIPAAHLREEKNTPGEETGEQRPEDFDPEQGGDPASRRYGEAVPDDGRRERDQGEETQQGGGGIGGTQP
jgi:hypothetical protein